MEATYTKLRSGEWGIRIAGSTTVGASVVVAKKSGERKTETVARIVWQGEGVTLAAIAPTSRVSSRSRRSRGTWTGCHCGSVEDQPRESDCFTCRHDA